MRADNQLEMKWGGALVVRDAYNAYKDPGVSFEGDPGMTDQSQTEDCDVNKIVDRFMKTGVLPGVDVERVYGDFSAVTDYHQAMNVISHAQQQFEGLDAKVRKRFGNDPAEFLAFCNDPKNAQELVKLGLAKSVATPPLVEGSQLNGGAANASNEVPVSGGKSSKDTSKDSK